MITIDLYPMKAFDLSIVEIDAGDTLPLADEAVQSSFGILLLKGKAVLTDAADAAWTGYEYLPGGIEPPPPSSARIKAVEPTVWACVSRQKGGKDCVIENFTVNGTASIPSGTWIIVIDGSPVIEGAERSVYTCFTPRDAQVAASGSGVLLIVRELS